jgi:hypothetical protein
MQAGTALISSVIPFVMHQEEVFNLVEALQLLYIIE